MHGIEEGPLDKLCEACGLLYIKVREKLGCRKLVLLGIFNLPVFDFTKYDVYYLLDLRNCAEI